MTVLRRMPQTGPKSAKKRNGGQGEPAFARSSLAHTELSPEGGRVTCRSVRAYSKYPPSPATGDRKLSLGGTPRVTSHESVGISASRSATAPREPALSDPDNPTIRNPRVSFTDLRIREYGRHHCWTTSPEKERERERGGEREEDTLENLMS
jgi:hypothetical protein